jgi:hypothetical protein
MLVNARWKKLTADEQAAYMLELSKCYTECENIRIQFREYKLRPSRSGPISNPFSVEIEKSKTLDLLAWKFEQAYTLYDSLLVKHMVGV